MPALSAPTTSSAASSPTCSTSFGSRPTEAAAARKIGACGLPLPKARALKAVRNHRPTPVLWRSALPFDTATSG
ncbi:hypothetical protein D3C87_1064390 [compost metagenome]